MKLIKAKVTNYRSVVDSGWIEFERLKTILVGPNESGKTVILRALQLLNRPDNVQPPKILSDYPRSLYADREKDSDSQVVVGIFSVEDEELIDLSEDFRNAKFRVNAYMSGERRYWIENVKDRVRYTDIESDFTRILAHMDATAKTQNPGVADVNLPSQLYSKVAIRIKSSYLDSSNGLSDLVNFLKGNITFVDEDNHRELQRYESLVSKLNYNNEWIKALNLFASKVPTFVLFSNYFRVRPVIHLEHLAARIDANNLDDEYYDYGNNCLLKLLGFTARELAELGRQSAINMTHSAQTQELHDRLSERQYKLNAASVKLSTSIQEIWNPDETRSEASKVKLFADGQFLKVMVEDEIGVEVELDQRSEGFQWMVSFFIVFFSEAVDKHKNAILLLDEPGMSLHAIKQREYRKTLTKLAENNQTIFTTHSPFLVGPNELDIVRVVEMGSRREGTKVHSVITSSDPAAMLPLQEALGYDLAHSLFSHNRNLILEGLTDYWYFDSVAQLLAEDGLVTWKGNISLVFSNTASKVVYYATILHAHNLKVAALLDSDNAGDQAAQQESLVHTLGNKSILRTKDFCGIEHAEIEDLLRDTLPLIIKDTCSLDIVDEVAQQPSLPIMLIIKKVNKGKGISKYDLAKNFIRWTREHSSSDLSSNELKQWISLIEKVNAVLK
ncbi:AAA family ATPase [Shewanella sp. DW31]|uniref:AAA family ATPase n=1 Tax=Shewanella sp. DW31 TaxID=2699422 RepID=UPI0018E2BBBD|nr:AAA family ATPase [Shewanella sp. DW31]MBI1676033.1 AAA family ATPase [Shewanella sp. DW31]